MIGNSGDSTYFPHELLLTNRQVSNLRKVFAKNRSTDIKLSKTQLSKMIRSGGFLGRLSKNWITFNEKCNEAIGQKCFTTIRINSSSISSRCRNT